MATRKQIIARATEIIKEYPLLGKNAINKQLREELGTGLRSTEILKLKRTLVSPVVAEQALTVSRYQSLRKEGFLPKEATFYAQRPISSLGMKKIRRFRKSEIREARTEGIPETGLAEYITESYEARQLLTDTGDISPEKWNTQVFYEIEKPLRERETVAIPANRYKYYRRSVRANINKPDSLRLATRIPPEQWTERSEQYRILKRAHFAHWECIKIVSTRTKPDKEGKRRLQSLDLNTSEWQRAMAERNNWYRERMQHYRKKKLTYRQAQRAVMGELEDYYKGRRGDSRSDPTPWDFLRSIYKISDRPQMDFAEGARLRQQRFTKKKMPYRVRR